MTKLPAEGCGQSPVLEEDIILPHKPSALIRIGVADLHKAIERGDDINMYSWASFRINRPCSVCFAGAVMRGTLGLKDDQVLEKFKESVYGKPNDYCNVMPEDYEKNVEQLEALNYLRCGDTVNALNCLGYGRTTGYMPVFKTIVEYSSKNHNQFVYEMLSYADELESFGY